MLLVQSVEAVEKEGRNDGRKGRKEGKEGRMEGVKGGRGKEGRRKEGRISWSLSSASRGAPRIADHEMGIRKLNITILDIHSGARFPDDCTNRADVAAADPRNARPGSTLPAPSCPPSATWSSCPAWLPSAPCPPVSSTCSWSPANGFAAHACIRQMRRSCCDEATYISWGQPAGLHFSF